VLAHALNAACSITVDYNRAEALAALAPHLARHQLARAMAAVPVTGYWVAEAIAARNGAIGSAEQDEISIDLLRHSPPDRRLMLTLLKRTGTKISSIRGVNRNPRLHKSDIRRPPMVALMRRQPTLGSLSCVAQ
jgi:hypothetical protein